MTQPMTTPARRPHPSKKPIDVAAVKAEIRQRAIDSGAYDAAFWSGDEWRLVRLRRSVKTGMGKAFVKGEVSIARIEPQPPHGDGVLTFCREHRIGTVLDFKDVEWLEPVHPAI